VTTTRKNSFVEVSKNLTEYRFENNCVERSNWLLEYYNFLQYCHQYLNLRST